MLNKREISLLDFKKWLLKSISQIKFQRLLIIAVSAIFMLFFLLSPVFYFLNAKSYDTFLAYIKRDIKDDNSLVLLDIDDNSMNSLKTTWPIPRDYHADVIELLSDFEAKAAVFDIEFLEESVYGADDKRIELVKNELMNKFQLIFDNYVNTTNSILKNRTSLRDIDSLWGDFNSRITEYYFDLEKKISDIKIDKDRYFADRLKYFGRAYGTVNMLYDPNITEKDINPETYKREIALLERYGYKKAELLKGKKIHSAIETVNISEFPIDKILNEYRSVGFTFVKRDRDATIRGINLFMERDGYVVPQLSFSPFLDIFGISKAQIDLSNSNYVILRDVSIDNKKIDIKIPVHKGLLMINWPKGEFKDIFANKIVEGKKYHFSYFDLLNYKYVILKQFLNSLEKNFGKFHETTEEFAFYQFFVQMEKEKERMIEDHIFTDEIKREFLNEYENTLLKLKDYLNEENIDKKMNELTSLSKEKKEEIKKAMFDVKESLGIFLKARDSLKFLKDKICFIGHTATSTTDIGVTPFDKTFENVGVHPSIFNTILQRDFIYIIDTAYIFLFFFVLFSILIWFFARFDSFRLTIFGFGSIFVIFLFIALFFRLTNVYITPVVPLSYGFFSTILLIGVKFIVTEREKSFIRGALDKYVSPDYIDEILKDRVKLNLGGERRVCTAIFTDIQGFSSISEKFMSDPPGLVSLLKDYLSTMSNIILENRGTIDKYEGDAIIAFFGAPKEMEDHAYRACLSAIRMKQIENELNKSILSNKIIDTPLITRIGINTGEMFIGNMGTENKFNYTMIGHAVNLASRLEGVNKQYGTYTLISEYTYNDVKDKIIARRLDRVRVVNINTPVRLYELLALKDECDKEIIDFLKIYDRALDEFEMKNWKESLAIFNEALAIKSGDTVIKIYIDRCKNYIKKGAPENWDGVYTLSVK